MIRDEIIASLKKVTGEKEVHLETPGREEYGDYATNVALQVKDLPARLAAKRAGKTGKRQEVKGPGEIAEEIVQRLKKDKGLSKLVSKIEVAGPGFINFWLLNEVLLDELLKVNRDTERYGTSKVGVGKTAIVEYSSPNIAKAFGIGHLRSTTIGQALYNLYKFLGYKTIGDNHIGDWGTQFGVLLAETKNSKLKIQNLSLEELEKMYVAFHKRAEVKPELWDEARDWFKKLEEGDKTARKIWKVAKEISLKEFDRTYELLGIEIDNTYAESFYENKMQAVIEEVRKKGLVKKSKGAEIVEFDNLPPAMLIKSDGATTYFTRDLATVAFRMEKWKPDIIIYEVGSEQTLHFRQVFRTAEIMGWLNCAKLVHVPHGLIRFAHGKMATRTGRTVKLEDVLKEAVHRAEKIIEKSETTRGLSKTEKKTVAKAVGIGAIKYFDLMHHPTSDIIFDWEKMFVLEGNSAPYLQYTFARTQSVLAKITNYTNYKLQITNENLEFRIQNLELSEEEFSLMRSFIHFPEVIEDAAQNYSPNLLCNYLFDLAQKFNHFYARHRILGINNERSESDALRDQKHRIIDFKVKGKRQEVNEFRLALTAGTGHVLKKGLGLLGIETPERM